MRGRAMRLNCTRWRAKIVYVIMRERNITVYGTIRGRDIRKCCTMRGSAMRVYGTMRDRALRLYGTMRGWPEGEGHDTTRHHETMAP